MMKHILNIFLYIILIFVAMACDDGLNGTVNEMEDGAVVLAFNADGSVQSRTADTNPEAAVSHLDVMFFTADPTNKRNSVLYYHERVNIGNSSAQHYGTFKLKKERKDFIKGDSYWVYVVANSTAASSAFDIDGFTLGDLDNMKQVDENIHLSLSGISGTPQWFVMDGVAYFKSAGEGDYDIPIAITPTALIVNDGTAEPATLKVILRRAAAKVVIDIKAATTNAKVKFNNTLKDENGVTVNPTYYFRNMPYDTWVVNANESAAVLKNTTPLNGAYYEWNADGSIRIIGYVYAHDWNNESTFDHTTSLIVNIPLEYYPQGMVGENPNVENRPNSWFQLLLSKDKKFERNTYYHITATVNAPGAEVIEEVIEVEDLLYEAMEWNPVDINITGSTGAAFLKVNKNHLKIYNTDTDASLYYTSSSPVTITIVNSDVSGTTNDTPYYINKFGVKTYVNPTTLGMNATEAVDNALSGNINIYSPNPINNAIRYFTIKVTNEEGLTEIITVEQYPLIWITNILGWYSYRDDFTDETYKNGRVTTYEKGYDPYYIATRWYDGNWINDYLWWTPHPDNTQGRFFGSLVATENRSSNQSYAGKSTIYYYSYTTDVWDKTTQTNVRLVWEYKAYDDNDYGNARMYNIHVSSTSNDYIVGRPRLSGRDSFTGESYTDGGKDNELLVSPSFMLASQLGITGAYNINTYVSANINQSQQHCARYVEVYKDPNTGETIHLRDWRLPTKAELDFVVNQQHVQNAPMDIVLVGAYYMSSTGYVKNNKYVVDPNNLEAANYIYTRCVRDVYEE